MNGAIDNRNTFNVAEIVTSNSTFLNEKAASLNVNSGSYTVSGLLTNYSAITVQAGAALNGVGGILNMPGFTVVNHGTITDDLSNSGLESNAGGSAYNANVALNNGTINNYGAWTGNVNQNANVAGGVINNYAGATWTGPLSYNDGGTINNFAGATWTGAIVNEQGFFKNTGTINGGVTGTGGVFDSFTSTSVINGNVNVTSNGTSNGAVYALNTISGNVSVSGNGLFYVGDHTAVTQTSTLGQILNVNGAVTGGITIPVNMATGASNVINVSGSTAGASANLARNLQNPANLVLGERRTTR